MDQNSLINNVALIVFAKIPDSPVKTRIAATEGDRRAKQIYLELLYTTAHTLKNCEFHVAYANSAEPEELTQIFTCAQSFFQQDTGTLGKRLLSACKRFALIGYRKFCVIGTDCPFISKKDINITLNALRSGYDLVIGPAEDGGYYLAGVNNKGMKIFDAQNWSTPYLLKETMAIANTNKLKTLLLNTKFDVDLIADYNRWKSISQMEPL